MEQDPLLENENRVMIFSIQSNFRQGARKATRLKPGENLSLEWHPLFLKNVAYPIAEKF